MRLVSRSEITPLFDRLAESDAGVETLADDICEFIGNVEFHCDIRIHGQKCRKHRYDSYLRRAPKGRDARGDDRVGLILAEADECCSIRALAGAPREL